MVPTQTTRNLHRRLRPERINSGAAGEEQELGYFGVKRWGLEAGKSGESLPWQSSGHVAPGASSCSVAGAAEQRQRGQCGADLHRAPQFPFHSDSVQGETRHPAEEQPRGKGRLRVLAGFGDSPVKLNPSRMDHYSLVAGCEAGAQRRVLGAVGERTFSYRSQRHGMESP